MRVTSLSDELYGQEITSLLDIPTRQTRGASQQSMAAEGVSSREESGLAPHNPPPSSSYVGSNFTDYFCLAVGVENRGQLRRLEDYLADHGQTLLPVS